MAGTEKGITEPSATFSSCFGAPFLPLAPGRYAAMLGDRIETHRVSVWLVNTGWTGGAYGVGRRIQLAHTRAMIRAALSGALDHAQYHRDPIFNLEVPTECAGIPTGLLVPKSTWADQGAFERQALTLAGMFADNFKRFAGEVEERVRRAGPTPP